MGESDRRQTALHNEELHNLLKVPRQIRLIERRMS